MEMPHMELPKVPDNWHRAHKKSLTLGDRAADKLRNGMGSWGFVFGALLILASWTALNTLTSFHHWDEFPFILLNLFLSMLAALQGAILLIAAKRADAVSDAMAQHDYETNIAAKKEVEQLMAINQRQLKMVEELVAELKKSR
jgi:uncharacterized membrane protein